jgi:hypothetical protein
MIFAKFFSHVKDRCVQKCTKNNQNAANYDNFLGEWIGHYEDFNQVVNITRIHDCIQAKKITGDDYVPAEEITWMAHLYTYEGQGQVAEKGFRNPRWVPGRLEIVSSEIIIFHWEEHGCVEFRKDN